MIEEVICFECIQPHFDHFECGNCGQVLDLQVIELPLKLFDGDPTEKVYCPFCGEKL